MPDQNHQTGPDPDPIGEPLALSPEETQKLHSRMGALASLAAVGGVLTFGLLAAPTRTSGASRSAKLKWLERQEEIRKAVASEATDSKTPAVNKPGQSSPS